MKHKGTVAIILLWLLTGTGVTLNASGQAIRVVRGQVSDSVTGEVLAGATIWNPSARTGTTTDDRGNYSIVLGTGNDSLVFQFVGYASQSLYIPPPPPDTLRLDVRLSPSIVLMNEIVVSAGRYEQKLSEVMVSLDIIKPDRIAGTNTTSVESILKQSAGVDIIDGQTSIRGGSGYSYGAGSRVLVLVDDLPILSADAGDVKWDYLPVENISQIEIIKGASSVLFGSSALNGVFNIRTAYPSEKPETQVSLYSGLYMDPRRDEMIWWNSRPAFGGLQVLHTRRAGNADLVVGGNLFSDMGYKENEYQRRARINANIRLRSKRVEGLAWGVALNGMILKKSDFLLWQDAGPGSYRQNPASVSALTGNRFNIDPFVVFNTVKGSQHSLKTRFYHVQNNFLETTDKNSLSDLLFGEYKYHGSLGRKTSLTGGLSATWSSTTASLYGNHRSFNMAIYLQGDYNPFPRVNLSAGVRMEHYQLDDEKEYSLPVFRAGLNYRVMDFTYLRASFGQGYRFPAIAEKYTTTSLATLNIFPNPALLSEKGWSGEAGLKQGIRLGSWNGYVDVAGFWTEYHEMIEFTFGIYKPDTVDVPTTDHIGFKALNVGNSRITGFDISLLGEGKVGGLPLSLVTGYTFTNPLDLNTADSLSSRTYLKYRFRHSAKADAELDIGRLTVGAALVLYSRMENIDEVFLDPVFGELILPGFRNYWQRINKGYAVWDLRILYDLSNNLNLSLIVKNLLNKEYMLRPGNIQAPRNVALRLNLSW